jgi:hypothetical protein
MTGDQLASALQAEYLQLQKTIEDFDSRALTIKAWSVSFSLVAIAGAFVSKSKIVLLVASLSAFLFWLLEGRWKGFQYAYYERSKSIEAHFRGEVSLPAPFQIGTAWSVSWREGGVRRIAWILTWPQVALPHMAICVVALTIFVLVHQKVIKL